MPGEIGRKTSMKRCLVRPDWRLWVEAVKSENESWNTFDACEELPYNSIVGGASVIPLGELFTIKEPVNINSVRLHWVTC